MFAWRLDTDRGGAGFTPFRSKRVLRGTPGSAAGGGQAVVQRGEKEAGGALHGF